MVLSSALGSCSPVRNGRLGRPEPTNLDWFSVSQGLLHACENRLDHKLGMVPDYLSVAAISSWALGSRSASIYLLNAVASGETIFPRRTHTVTSPRTRPSLAILLLLLAECSSTGKGGGTGGSRNAGIGGSILGGGGTLGTGGSPGLGGAFASTGGTLGSGSGGMTVAGGKPGIGGISGPVPRQNPIRGH